MSHIKPDENIRHRVALQIRFNDIDRFGHLNNSVYIQFFDMGKLAYFKQFMNGSFDTESTIPVVANINCNFFQPTMPDEQLEVRTTMKSLGSSSLTLHQEIVSDKGVLKCAADTVMVNIELASGVPTPISDAWRAAFEEYEGRAY